MSIMKIENLEAKIGDKQILKGLNLELEPGKVHAIMGPNGSGKTTLLKSISRVLKPKKGAILIDESDIYQMKTVDVAKQLAVVPQETPVSFDFTALEVVLMGRNPHMTRFKMESKNDLEIAKKSMQVTRTWDFADRPVTELSGGERQRVIIARALTQEPQILLFLTSKHLCPEKY